MADRARAWADTLISASFPVVSSQVVVNLLTTLIPSDMITAVRLVIRLQCVPQNLSDDIDGGTTISFGIGVSALEAFTALVLPDPEIDADVPARGWLWKSVMLAVANSVTGPPAHDVYFGTTLEADVRAMRKVDRGVLYLSMRSTDNAVSGSYLPTAVIGLVRVLCLT